MFENLPRHRLPRWSVGIVAAVLATAIRLALDPLLDAQMPWPVHFAAVTAAAWFGGGEAGVVAVAASTVLVEYLVIPPPFHPHFLRDFPSLIVFSSIALLLVWQVGRWRRSEQALRQNDLQLRDLSERLQAQLTDRNRAEEALRLSEERYRSLVEAAPDAVLIHREGRIAYVNPCALTLFGASSIEQLMGRPVLELYDPSDHSLVAERAAAVRAGAAVPVVEEKIVRLDGRIRHVEAATAPCRYGDQMGIQVVLRDITERKLAEAEIASIYDSAPIGLCIFDRDGRYLRINRRLAEINGLAPEAHIGRTFHEIIPSIADQAEPLLREVVQTGRSVRDVEIRGELPSAPGVMRTWIEHWYPVKDGAGAVVGVNVAVEEITAIKQVEQELRDANRAKDTFLATLSHELRTPMTAIVGWAHMLEHGIIDERLRIRAVESISRNAQAQNRLIGDVLDMSRALTGKLRLDVQEVDILSVLAEAVESIRPAADAKQVTLDLSATVGAGTVWADPARIQQVFWNLLSNAVKFTPPEGSISVAVTRGASTVDIMVVDTGMGIRSDFLPHVFDRFAQADSSTSRQHGGLGIGLSIVRQLVELHGGRVYAASEGEGRGATFTVSLPFRTASKAPARGPDLEDASADEPLYAQELAGMRALVVDDVEDAREFVTAVLEQAGVQVIQAASAQEALRALSRERPDVVIADVGMPEADGYELVRRLRALPASRGGKTVAIALTAYGSAADRVRALTAGFNEHLVKPIAPVVLLRAVARIVTRQRRRHDEGPITPSVRQRSR